MSSPLAHAVGAIGAYCAATAPNGAAKLRGATLLGLCVAMAVLPDLPALFVAAGPSGVFESAQKVDVVALLHGLTIGLLASAALAGAFPGLRESFWTSALVLFAAHSSQALLDAATRAGVPWLYPFDRHALGFGMALLPTADARILTAPFAQAVKVMLVEVGILFPLVWTSWIVGRESGESKTKGWLVVYALSWPVAAGLVIWSMKNGGSFR